MKKKDVRKIVEANIDNLKAALGLSSWRVFIDYGPALIDGDDTHYNGKCNTDPAIHETALITLDPKQLDSEAEILEVLRHELAHCIAASFNTCQAVLATLLTRREYRALDVLFHIAHERVVGSIQSILESKSSAG